MISKLILFYDNNLLFVENAMYATKIAKPAARISELTQGPLNAPECGIVTVANGVIDSTRSLERWALRTAPNPSSSNKRILCSPRRAFFISSVQLTYRFNFLINHV